MKVIFLDFDGVLNSDAYVQKHWKPGVIIDSTRLALLKRIINETGAEVVLSTSWRRHWDKDESKCNETGMYINRIFSEIGVCIYDKTPEIHNERDQEIEKWLSEHPETEQFAVLDDFPFEHGIFRNHFVLTSRIRFGMDEDDAKKAVDILNKC